MIGLMRISKSIIKGTVCIFVDCFAHDLVSVEWAKIANIIPFVNFGSLGLAPMYRFQRIATSSLIINYVSRVSIADNAPDD